MEATSAACTRSVVSSPPQSDSDMSAGSRRRQRGHAHLRALACCLVALICPASAFHPRPSLASRARRGQGGRGVSSGGEELGINILRRQPPTYVEVGV